MRKCALYTRQWLSFFQTSMQQNVQNKYDIFPIPSFNYCKYSKNTWTFCAFQNLTFWNWGGNMNFFAVFLRKLEPSGEIGAYSAAIFRKVLYKKWLLLALSLSQYRVLYVGITSTKRCGPQNWRSIRVLRRGRKFPWQESCNLNIRWHLQA